jgi:hypothetical protein
LSSVTTLRFDNGLCFEIPKYAHCFLLNSRHFEVWRHMSSQASMRRVQRCQIKLSWVTLSYSVGGFILLFQVWKL